MNKDSVDWEAVDYRIEQHPEELKDERLLHVALRKECRAVPPHVFWALYHGNDCRDTEPPLFNLARQNSQLSVEVCNQILRYTKPYVLYGETKGLLLPLLKSVLGLSFVGESCHPNLAHAIIQEFPKVLNEIDTDSGEILLHNLVSADGLNMNMHFISEMILEETFAHSRELMLGSTSIGEFLGTYVELFQDGDDLRRLLNFVKNKAPIFLKDLGFLSKLIPCAADLCDLHEFPLDEFATLLSSCPRALSHEDHVTHEIPLQSYLTRINTPEFERIPRPEILEAFILAGKRSYLFDEDLYGGLTYVDGDHLKDSPLEVIVDACLSAEGINGNDSFLEQCIWGCLHICVNEVGFFLVLHSLLETFKWNTDSWRERLERLDEVMLRFEDKVELLGRDEFIRLLDRTCNETRMGNLESLHRALFDLVFIKHMKTSFIGKRSSCTGNFFLHDFIVKAMETRYFDQCSIPLKGIVDANVFALEARDVKYGLYPFMLAAASGDHNSCELNDVFMLLRRHPGVIEMIAPTTQRKITDYFKKGIIERFPGYNALLLTLKGGEAYLLK